MKNEKEKTENEENETCGLDETYSFSFPEGTQALGVIIYESLDELKKDVPQLKPVKDEFDGAFVFFIGIKKEKLSITEEERKKREKELFDSIEGDMPPRKEFVIFANALKKSENEN
jgi:hypothetical protein